MSPGAFNGHHRPLGLETNCASMALHFQVLSSNHTGTLAPLRPSTSSSLRLTKSAGSCFSCCDSSLCPFYNTASLSLTPVLLFPEPYSSLPSSPGVSFQCSKHPGSKHRYLELSALDGRDRSGDRAAGERLVLHDIRKRPYSTNAVKAMEKTGIRNNILSHL